MDEHDGLTPRERAALARNPYASLASTHTDGSQNMSPEASGVGGWLGFLVAILILISPVLSIVLTFLGHQEALEFNPRIRATDQWQTIQLLDWSTVFGQISLSVTAGLLLLKRRRRSTKWLVIALIWLSSVGVNVLGFVIALDLFPDSLTAADLGTSLGRPIIFSLIWTLYLLLSKRVKRTYVE